MGKYFSSTPLMAPFGRAQNMIIGCLNSALGGNGSITVKASKKGMSISLGKSILAKGKTPDELLTNFEAALAQAKQEQVTV